MASGSALSETISSRFVIDLVRFERMCQLIVLLIGAYCAFAGRNLPVGPDGLAYLDVARAYLQHNWHIAVNGYWGPLYSWLLALAMGICRPGVDTEFAVVRAVNFLVFSAALYAFSVCWHALADCCGRTDVNQTSIPEAAPYIWITLGYLLFIVNFAWFVDLVSPDILVAAIVFAIAAFLFKLNDHLPHGVGAYAWLGALLVVGYYAKAILLYFAVFVLGATAIQGFLSGNIRKPLTAILAFAALVFPFVVVLSQSTGHFTPGDSGRLNYAWFVDGPETKTWMNSDGAPLPFYPGPVAPGPVRVFRLPSLEGVTYAPWYDAARFDQRAHPAFNKHGQLRQLAINLQSLKEEFLGSGAVLLVPLLLLACYTPKVSLRNFASTWFCIVPVIAVFGMYLLVHLVTRFVLGFSLVLWGAAFASVRVPSGLQRLAQRAMLVGTLVFAAITTPGLLHYVVSPRKDSVVRDIAIAEALPHYGLTPGSLVGSIGDGQVAYWAHLARVSVVAEVWSIDSARFWSAPPAAQQAVLRSMTDAGAKAVIWREDSDQGCPADWISFPQHSGCMISMR